MNSDSDSELQSFGFAERLAVVAAARQVVALHARAEFVYVHLRHVVQFVAQVAGEGGAVPHDVADLLDDFEFLLGGELLVGVADHFFDLVGHFARFARKSERGVDDAAVVGVDRRFEGVLLIFVESHRLGFMS